MTGSYQNYREENPNNNSSRYRQTGKSRKLNRTIKLEKRVAEMQNDTNKTLQRVSENTVKT